jgi:hypothetical protein
LKELLKPNVGITCIIKNVFNMYGIDRENRQCLKCNSRSIGDEFHYIMECHFFTENRTQKLHIKKQHNTYMTNK